MAVNWSMVRPRKTPPRQSKRPARSAAAPTVPITVDLAHRLIERLEYAGPLWVESRAELASELRAAIGVAPSAASSTTERLRVLMAEAAASPGKSVTIPADLTDELASSSAVGVREAILEIRRREYMPHRGDVPMLCDAQQEAGDLSPEQEAFCTRNCCWSGHHKDCPRHDPPAAGVMATDDR